MTDLQQDIAQEVKEGSVRLLPEGPAPVGYVATVTGAAPFKVDYVQPPRKELLRGHGDPNGIVFAEKGVGLYVDLDTPALWQNTDGGTTWAPIGGAGGATFPITYDDGTWTYELTAVSGMMRISVTEDADPTNTVTFDLLPPTSSLDSPDGFALISGNSGAAIVIHATDAGSISLTAGTVIEINTDTGSGDVSIGEANAGSVDLVAVRVRFFQNAAPADAALFNSSFALWLDDTPGATKLKIKAKDSAGTVRTADIALS